MWFWLTVAMALADDPIFEVAPPLFAETLEESPSSTPLPRTEVVFCFSPEVKLKFGKGTRVELYPAAKQRPEDWQETEPDPPEAFNLGGPQEP